MTSKNETTITHLTDATFQAEVKENSQLVLVDFWAPWCGPCLMITPILEELAGEFEGKLKICKMNVDENQQVAGQFGIQAIPTLMLFKDGEQKERITGVQPKQEFTRLINNHLSE